MVVQVEVRVLQRERHNLTSTPTQYGLESGDSLSDHVKLNPNMVEVQFEMTNTERGAEEARDVMMQFVKKREERQPLTLETEHARYENMVIVGFHPDHSAPFKGAYRAILRLAQVGFVGMSDMVSATGGRPSKVLKGDGTDKTAGGYSYAGQCQPGTDGATISACQSALGA